MSDEKKSEAVLGQMNEINFEPAPDGYILVTFAVPDDTRWTAGDYEITKIQKDI